MVTKEGRYSKIFLMADIWWERKDAGVDAQEGAGNGFRSLGGYIAVGENIISFHL